MAEGPNTLPGMGQSIDPASCVYPTCPPELPLHQTGNSNSRSTQRKRAQLLWLASFPELNSSPVIEVDLVTGSLVYANPAARQLMPDLARAGLNHPWTEGLALVALELKRNQSQTVRREVQIGDSFFEQSITSPGSARLRIYGHDITSRVRLQQQLETAKAEALEAKHRLEAVMEMLPVGVALTNPEGNCTKVNAMFHRICGESVPAPQDPSITTVASQEPAQWSTFRSIALGESTSNAVLQIRRSDGSNAFVLTNKASVLKPDQTVIGSAIAIMDVTQRFQAEQALRQSQADLKHAQEVARTGSWRLDLKKNQLVWSDEVYRIFNIPKGSPLSYETFLAAVHPDARAYVDACWQAALKGRTYDCEHRLAGDGPVRWVRERAVLEFDVDGSLASGFGTVQDITEKKEAEEALRQAKEEWERTFDAVPDLIAIIDDKHRVRRVNRAMAQRLGLPAEECIGRKCHELVHGTTCPPGICPHSRTISDGQECAVEVQEPRLGGHFLVTTTALKDENGLLLGSVHVARDITSSKHVERRLAESEQRYRSLINVSPDAILVTKDDRISFVNPAGLSLFGVNNRDDLLGRNVFDFLVEADRPQFGEAVWRLHEAEAGTMPALVCRIAGSDGQTREAELSAVPVHFDGADAVQLVFRDITQRNQAQRALQESQQRLNQAMLVGRCFAFEWHPETDKVIRSHHCQAILGLTEDEATYDTGQQFFLRVHPEDRVRFVAAVKALTPATDSYRMRYHVTRPDGEVVALEETGRGTFDSEGRMTRLIGFTFDFTELERNQLALRRSEQRYALAQRAGNVASWEWFPDSDELLWSEHVQEVTGLEPEGSGHTLRDYLERVHPEDRNRVEQAFRNVGRDGAGYDIEYRLVLKDGTIRWVSGVGETHSGGSAQPLRMVGIVADITRRKLAEQARADYLERVNTLVQVSREIIAEASIPGLMKLAAAAAEKLTHAGEVLFGTEYSGDTFRIAAQRRGGLELAEAAGRVATVSPDDRCLEWLQSRDTIRSSFETDPLLPEWWSACGERAMRGGILGARLTARDGSVTGFLLLSDKVGGFTTEDESLLAQLAALVSVGRQRLEAKQEALRRGQELQAVFSSMSEIVVIYDANGVPTRANPATAKLFGFDPVGVSVGTLVTRLDLRHPGGRKFQAEELPCYRALMGERVRNMRMAFTGAAGANYIVVASAAQLTDGQQLLGAVCVWHDVTDRERLVNELERRVQERTAGLKETVRLLEEEIKERHRAEQALAESEEQYRVLFQSAPVGIVMTDYDGNVYAANHAAKSLLGWSRPDFRGLRAHRHYADVSDRDRMIASAKLTGHAENLDLQLKRLDGTRLFAAIRVSRVELRGQQKLMTLVQDLTAEKDAQRRDQGVRKLLELFATQASRQDYLSAVVRFLSEWCGCHCAGIRLQTRSGGMPYVAHIGFSREFIRAEEQLCLESIDCACIRALRKESMEAERPYATPHGSFICNQLSRWLRQVRGPRKKHLPCAKAKFESLAHVPIRFDNKVQGAIHLADRTPNKFPEPVSSFIEAISPVIGEALHRFTVEAELREREERLRSMFEHHEAIMLLVEADTGAITDANAAASRFYGFSEQRLRGMRMQELDAFPAPCRKREHRPVQQQEASVYLRSHRLASGELRSVEVHSSPVRMGSRLAHFCIIHDITERKRLEQRVLEIGDKERQDIGRDLHDSLGGHLTGIALITKGLAQTLREKKVPETAIAEELVEAVNQAVTQSRSIARGVCPVGLGRVGLAAGLQQYALSASKMFRLRFSFRARGDVTVPDDLVATHLYRIVQEAVTNAVRHAGAKLVSIRLVGTDQTLSLSVSDDGCGFDIPASRGHGMGMRSMQYRADLVGACLTLTSAPGKGTCVSCVLPRR